MLLTCVKDLVYKFLACLDRCEEAMLKVSHNTLYLERRQLTFNQHQDLSYRYSNFIYAGVWFNNKEGRDILSLPFVHAYAYVLRYRWECFAAYD